MTTLAAAWAQVTPGLINFQGRLTDSSNNPLSGSHDFIFSLHGTATGGIPVWTESQAGISVSNGVFAVQLGAASPLTHDLFTATTLYLQISVDGVMLSPRERLAGVAYAFNADRLQGFTPAYFVSTAAVSQTIAGAKTFTGTLTVPAPTVFSGQGFDPAGTPGAIYYNSVTSKLRLYNGSGFVDIATGTISGISTINSESAQFSGDGAGNVLTLKSSSVTLQGNLFNAANSLVKLDGTSRLPAVDGSQLTGVSAAQVPASGVQAGSLGAGVIASSIAAGAITGDAQIASGAGIAQSKIANLTTDIGARLLKAGDSMSGDLQIGGASASTYSASGYLTMANLSSPPSGARGRLYFDSTGSGALRISLDGSSFVPISTGSSGGSGGLSEVASDASQFSGQGISGSALTLKSSSVTLQGNVFNAANKLVLLDAAGKLPAIDGSQLTGLASSDATKVAKAGDTMTGDLQVGAANASTVSASGFMTLANLGAAPTAATGRLYFDSASKKLRLSTGTASSSWVDLSTGGASGLSSISADSGQFSGDGSSPATQLTLLSSSVTLQGNSFNAANKLVRLDGTGKLPAVDGSLLTGIAASDSTKLAKAGDTMTGDLQVGAANASTVSASGFITFANLGAQPGASRGRLYFDPTGSGSLRVSLDGASFVPISTGAAGAGMSSVNSTAAEFTGDGSGVPLKLNSSSVTLQGNAFNGNNQLVRLDGTGKLPAVDGSLLTGITATVVTAAGVQTGSLGSGVIASSIAAAAINSDNQIAAGAAISQSKIASLTTDLGARLLKAGDSMSGDLQVGAASASTLSASGFLSLANLAAAPGAAVGRLYYDSSSRTLRLSTGTASSSWVDLSTGASSGGAGGPHAASHAPGGGDAIDASYLALAGAQTITGVKTHDANLVMGTGQITSAAGQLGVTVSTSLFVSGPLRLASLASDPANTYNGQMYYNTSSNLVRFNMNGIWTTLSTGPAGGGAGGFWGDASPHIYNTNAGNVGMGTASPGEKLDLAGAMVFRGIGAPGLSSAGQAKVYFDSSSNKFKISESGTAFTNLIGGAGGAVTLQGSFPGSSDSGHLNLVGSGVFGSSVAIGTQSPLSRLHIVDGDIRIATTTGSRGIIFQDGSVQNTASGNSLWATAGSHIANANAGNVGIGTTNPGGRFEVAGSGNVIFNTSGNVGVGTTNPGQKLSVAGVIESTSGGVRFPDGSVQTVASGASQWLAAGSNISNTNSANVGVGTGSPAARLHVSSAGATSSDTLLNITTAAAAGSEVFSVKGDAKVGIGVGSPAYPLHIVSNLPVRATLMVDNNSSGANTSVAFRFAKNASDRWNIFTDVLQNGSNDLTFFDSVASSHRLYISGAGNVGMGTSSPQSKLDVAGSAAVGSAYAGTSAAPADGLIVQGNVGVGTSSPQAAFNAVGVSSFSANSAGPAFLVSQAGAGAAASFLGGRVGLGTTSPGERLDVDGAVIMRGMSLPSVAPANQAKLYFDSTAKKLKLSEDGGGFMNLIGGAGGAVTLQGSTPGSADAGHINITGTGIFGGNIQGSGDIFMDATGAGVTQVRAQRSTFSIANTLDLSLRSDSDADASGDIRFEKGASGSPVELMRLTNAGRLGIGTPAPGEMLDLGGAMVLRGIAAPGLASAGQGKMYFDSGSNKIKFSESGGAFINLIGGAGGAITLQGTTPAIADSGHLNISGTGLFGGNLGVGTGTPGQKLDIRSGGVAVSYNGTAGNSLYIDPSTGKTGIGTTNPVDRLHVAGAAVVGASYAGALAAPSNGLLVQGSVGVSTGSPQATLDVNGSFSAGSGVTKATLTATGDFYLPGAILPDQDSVKDLGSSSKRWNKLWVSQIGVASSMDMTGNALNNAGSITPQTDNLANLGTASKRWSKVQAVNVYTSGNVGVGTTNPANRLDVTGGGAVIRSSLSVTGAGLSGTETVFDVIGATLTVRNDGRVGIGSSVPTSTLTVVGLIESKGGGFKFPDGSIQTAASGASQWSANGSNVYNGNTANVGVGTNSPAYKLHVSSPGATVSDIVLAVTTAAASASEVFTVMGDGKVGVGTSAPATAFHVVSVAAGRTFLTVDNRNSAANASSVLRFAKNGSDTWNILSDLAQNGTNDFGIYNAAGAPGYKFYIKDTGEVGIGTTQPGSGSALNVVGISSMSNSGASPALSAYQNGAGPVAVFLGGKVGIGTASPAQPLSVAGIIESTVGGIKFPDGSVQTVASGASLWGANATHVYNTNAGNVGIGTTNPAHELHVGDDEASSAGASAFVLFSSATSAYVGVRQTANNVEMFLDPQSGGGKFGTLTSHGLAIRTGNIERVVIDTSSNMELDGSMIFRGIAAPVLALSGQGKIYFDTASSKLKISENGGAFTNLIGGAGGAITLQATTPGSSDSGNLNITGTGLFGGNIGVGIANPTQKLDIRSGGLALSSSSVAGGSLFASPSNGRVGVGTTSPSSNLHVYGVGAAAGRVEGTTEASLQLAGPALWELASKSDSRLALSQGGTERVTVDSSGNVGVATTSPSDAFEVGAATLTVKRSGLVGVGTNAPAGRLHVEGSGNILLNASGNVGVGTTNPAVRLHVAGNASVTGGDMGVGTTSPLSKLHVVDGDIRLSTTSGSRGIIFQDGSTMNTAPSGVSAWTRIAGLLYPATITDRLNIGRSDLGAGMIAVSTNATAAPALYVESGNGNVGLGTSSPAERLEVDGAMILRGMATPSLASAGQGKMYFDSSSNKIKISESGGAFVNLIGGAGGAVTLQGSTPGVPDTGNINLTGTGLFSKVGMGTNAPSQKLDIRSGGLAVSHNSTAGSALFLDPSTGRLGVGTTSPSERVQVLGGDVYVGAPSAHDTTSDPDLLVQGNVIVNGRIVQDGGGQSSFANLGVSTATSTGELFKVGAGTITALSSGRVGLGTLTPSVLLHIKSADASNSQLWIDRDSASTQKSLLSFRKQGAARYSLGTDLSDSGNNDFFVQDEVAAATRLYINSAGQMGIGTTSPSPGTKLDIAGAGTVMIRSASQFEVDTSNSEYVSFKANGLEVMRLKP